MPTRRRFLQSTALAPVLAAAADSAAPLDTCEIAKRHNIVHDLPTPNFFEGMLLGNGDFGLCVVTRPDALGFYLGKNDVWDIRVSEEHAKHVKPFAEVQAMWKRASERAKAAGRPDQLYLETNDPEMNAYYKLVASSYEKPYPRPWPCGTVWIHWDARQVRIVRQTLDIATAVYTLDLEWDDLKGTVRPVTVGAFVNRTSNHLCVWSEQPAPVLSVAWDPHVERTAPLPAPRVESHADGFSGFQLLPAHEDLQPWGDDRNFALEARAGGSWRPEPQAQRAFLRAASPQPLRLDIVLLTPRDSKDPVAETKRAAAAASSSTIQSIRARHSNAWREWWSRSAISLQSAALERIWYHNQYWLACCLRPGAVAPGLFGNWSAAGIGTAWHGDYHMNYNTQQVWWGVFSSNHPEQNLPYLELVESLMPMAEWNARVQFGLPGAYFPHSAYPVPSKVNPYPVPPWGYEICETPWTVQQLWWHYVYTLDRDYLARAYPLLRAATDFVVAYLKKGADGRYNVDPTVSPENWGLTVDGRRNRNCIIDIGLIEFLLDAMVEASRVLNRDGELRERWAEVRRNLAPYPSAEGPYGRVWLDIENAPVEYVYNVPVTAAPVFPAEQVGLDRRTELLEIARRTIRTIRLEGGNDLVWQPLMRARLGMLDLDWFLREVAYCTLPNGIANDRVRQIGGRYSDATNFDFMMRMGVWTENLSLPAVLNECLLQSYAGTIRLFPNTHNLGPCRFRDLRAAGAFLVSAEWDGTRVGAVSIASEKGGTVRLVNPWTGRPRVSSGGREIAAQTEASHLVFATRPGERYDLAPALS